MIDLHRQRHARQAIQQRAGCHLAEQRHLGGFAQHVLGHRDDVFADRGAVLPVRDDIDALGVRL